MKVVRGIEEGTNALCKGRGLNLADVPERLIDSIESLFGERLTPAQVVDRIVSQVQSDGDSAVRDLNSLLDGLTLKELEVPLSAISEAYDLVSEDIVEALEIAALRVRTFHETSRRNSWMDYNEGYGELISPMERVGAYVPGGTAYYPSTVLMSAIPAKIAGVDEVVICTPPARGSELPHPSVLVAADIAGVDRVFRIGGAQAIAAMAYGTETVPKCDIICGPGNIFVTLAKKQVYGDVGIDGLYGPTETLVIADESANPTLCAVDLLAQAEHDALARPVLITTSQRIADEVDREVSVRLERLDRSSIARASVEEQGCLVVVSNLDEAFELGNRFAPEHMCLMINDPWSQVGKVRNAGAVFLGDFSHEVLGDYVAGPSHVMPTAGTARFNSGIGVHSFVKVSPVVALSDATSKEIAEVASRIARAEGLTAHAEAAEIREELL